MAALHIKLILERLGYPAPAIGELNESAMAKIAHALEDMEKQLIYYREKEEMPN